MRSQRAAATTPDRLPWFCPILAFFFCDSVSSLSSLSGFSRVCSFFCWAIHVKCASAPWSRWESLGVAVAAVAAVSSSFPYEIARQTEQGERLATPQVRGGKERLRSKHGRPDKSTKVARSERDRKRERRPEKARKGKRDRMRREKRNKRRTDEERTNNYSVTKWQERRSATRSSAPDRTGLAWEVRGETRTKEQETKAQAQYVVGWCNLEALQEYRPV